MEKMKQQNELERLRLETKNEANMQALKQQNELDRLRDETKKDALQRE